MEWCFYQWVVSFSLISAGNWATSDLEIDRSVSAPGPEPVSQCESVSDFRKWYDGTVRSNHLKLGIKFLNHRWIIILSICTTNPRLNERYTTNGPVRQKINHFPQGNRGYTLKINFQKLIISISNCMLLKNVANGFPFQRVLFPLLWPLSFSYSFQLLIRMCFLKTIIFLIWFWLLFIIIFSDFTVNIDYEHVFLTILSTAI